MWISKKRMSFELGEIDINDIAAAREAVQILSQVNAVDEVNFDAIDLITGELNASDISAARQAAHFLKTAEHVSDEINADDISAARQAANYLAAWPRSTVRWMPAISQPHM